MSSGQSRVKINTGERGVSDDINILQDSIARERNELALAIATKNQYNPWLTGVAASDHPAGAPATPPSMDVFSGLEMIVDNAGSILVNPGVVGIWSGNPSLATDSGYIVVVDPGIQTIGVLTYSTANSGGSIRCDVVEVQLAVDATVASQSRDIFNETTGLFTPALVPKTLQSKLTYRIRQGTPGACPGYAAGWTPIGLITVYPSGSQIDFFDVRPVVSARTRHYQDASPGWSTSSPPQRVGNSNVFFENTNGFHGWVETEWCGRILGGQISDLDGAPRCVMGIATDIGNGTGSVQPSDIEVLSIWMPLFGGTMLPRFMMYGRTAVNGRRRPIGTNGIFLLSAASALTTTGAFYATRPLATYSTQGVFGNAVGIPVAAGSRDSSGNAQQCIHKNGKSNFAIVDFLAGRKWGYSAGSNLSSTGPIINGVIGLETAGLGLPAYLFSSIRVRVRVTLGMSGSMPIPNVTGLVYLNTVQGANLTLAASSTIGLPTPYVVNWSAIPSSSTVVVEFETDVDMHPHYAIDVSSRALIWLHFVITGGAQNPTTTWAIATASGMDIQVIGVGFLGS